MRRESDLGMDLGLMQPWTIPTLYAYAPITHAINSWCGTLKARTLLPCPQFYLAHSPHELVQSSWIRRQPRCASPYRKLAVNAQDMLLDCT